MIKPDERKAIYCLHKKGINISDLSGQFEVDQKTVRTIIEQKGEMPTTRRRDKKEVDLEVLTEVYNDCEGWAERIHEKLTEEKGIDIGYSTLTRLLREEGIGKKKNQRCGRVDDVPGEEMQHDTTIYNRKIGDKKIRFVASILYFRYSKVRYLKFYRSFNRFDMKSFLHEALSFYGYCAKTCIIDNTNLARLQGSGTGKNAVIVPEMEEFARRYGFKFACHRLKHANRKAGNERSFYTVESNFFPGRNFKDLEDLNEQGLDWATVRFFNRPVSKTKLIPAKAFEFENPYLVKIPPYIHPPYIVLERKCDQYGYVHVDGNFFWVPGKDRFKAKVLKYPDQIKIYKNREFLIEYDLPAIEVKNEKFSPKGQSEPIYQPAYRKKSSANEEKKLRAVCQEIDDYLNFATKSMGKEKHRFIRKLYALYKKVNKSLFVKIIKRALTYRITNINTVESIASLIMKSENYHLPFVDIDTEYVNRDAYIEGCFNDDVDFSVYDDLLEEDE